VKLKLKSEAKCRSNDLEVKLNNQMIDM
jgi:hypothetical protein